MLKGKSLSQVRPAHLIAAAALLHLTFTITAYIAGRFALLPSVFDANGTGIFFASDGATYRAEAIALARFLARDGIIAWLIAPSPLHIRLYSLSFAVFSPLFGFNILSAEPLNLLCYLAILMLIFKLGLEVFDRRVALLAAIIVALWPSLLLHTTQLLKDTMFIAAMLALILVLVRWLTRVYSWRVGLVAGVAGGMISVVLWVVRNNMREMIPAVVLIGVLMFIARQILEWRIMAGNLLSVALVLVFVISVPLVVPTPPDFVDESLVRALVDERDIPPGIALSSPPAPMTEKAPASYLEKMRMRIGTARAGFKRYTNAAGSNIDVDMQFNSTGEVIRYLPRALAIGLFAPFPDMWFTKGNLTGAKGRLFSGLETLMMYVIELLALVALWHARRRLPAWLLLLIVLMGVTALGLVVVNIASLYRMRYVFLTLLIILGAKGAMEIIDRLSLKKRCHTLSTSPERRHNI